MSVQTPKPPRYLFPNPRTGAKELPLAIGGDYHVQTLVDAYEKGIFPWPILPDFPHAWFSPDPRTILKTDEFHLSDRTIRYLKKQAFSFSFNTNFSKVVEYCKTVPRKDQHGTWITNELQQGILDLHKEKKAYSVEVYEAERLVAGVYGVICSKYLSAESMFTLVDNGSKAALRFLCNYLHKKSIPYIDLQVINETTSKLGAKEISRDDFLSLIEESRPLSSNLFE